MLVSMMIERGRGEGVSDEEFQLGKNLSECYECRCACDFLWTTRKIIRAVDIQNHTRVECSRNGKGWPL
jgi:hypothetical protein